jgi:hypothetical protein
MNSGPDTFMVTIRSPKLSPTCVERIPRLPRDHLVPRSILGIRIVEGGFPHSEIRGSKVVRTSPRLIAAYHVLHRLSAPRHPPNTLKALDRSHDRCPPLDPCGAERWTMSERPLLAEHIRSKRQARFGQPSAGGPITGPVGYIPSLRC